MNLWYTMGQGPHPLAYHGVYVNHGAGVALVYTVCLKCACVALVYTLYAQELAGARGV